MAADNSVVAKVELPPLIPVVPRVRLAATPTRPPTHATRVRNAAGADVTLGCPKATRALVALMDVHAVNGGAACHWGGPAAFAPTLAAAESGDLSVLHGLLAAIRDPFVETPENEPYRAGPPPGTGCYRTFCGT